MKHRGRAFIGLVVFIVLIFGVMRGLAQEKPKDIAVKPEKTSIDFTASDAAKLAKLQLQIETLSIELNGIIKSYNIPRDWSLTVVEGNILGAHKEEVKKP